MPRFSHTIDSHTHAFASLKELLAKATPLRSGDVLAGVAASSARSGWRRSWRWRTCRYRCSSTRRWCRTKTTKSRA